MFPNAEPRGTLRVEGKENSLFPEGAVIISVLLYLRTQKIENREKWFAWLDAYGGGTRSTSSSETELSYRNDTIIVFVFAVTKNEDKTKISLASSNA